MAGYAALIEAFDLQLPLPPCLSAISQRHHPKSDAQWSLFGPRLRPKEGFGGQLEFALSWEGVNFSVLAALFKQGVEAHLEAYVLETPTGIYTRRAWFLYEWLTGRTLNLAPAGKVKAVEAIDPQFQAATETGRLSQRHKVIDNIAGTPAFCPMVRRTKAIVLKQESRLDERARAVVGHTRADLIARAARFLLISDTQASFAIEQVPVSGSKLTRWANAIKQAGAHQLSIREFERLQKLVIDDRWVKLGLRREGGWIGVRDRVTREPVPEHINARPEDVKALLEGIIAFGERALAGKMDPVIAAAIMGFGFVYVHPFADGNGRLHRWLIHHVLAVARFNPKDVVFPISSKMFQGQEAYREVLESYSNELMQNIEWRATPSGNVDVLNDTADFYRYFDATAHAEYLYDCLEQTVVKDLPDEIAFLVSYDRFIGGVQRFLDMTEDQADLLRKFLEQNKGRFSKRARTKEFAALTDHEADEIERLFAEAFRGADGNA